MNRKSILSLVLIAVLLAAMPTCVQAAKNLKMATIAPGSSAYLVMTTMATMVNQAQDELHINVDATGAATKHMIDLAEGKIDMCMTNPVIYFFMKNQKVMYKKLKSAPELSKNLRVLFWFPYGSYHVLTYAGSGIENLKDIKGKRVFLGPPGGGAWNASREWVVATTGLHPNKDFKNVKASWSSAFQGFQDRQFDVYIVGGIAPFPQVEQLALTSKLHLLGLSKKEYEANPEAIKTATKVGRELGIIPAGIYGKGIDNQQDIYTLGGVVGVSVNKNMDDDTAYQLVKLFWEQAKKNSQTHPWLKHLTMAYGAGKKGMKLHPGAAKYYQEQGIKVPVESQ